MAHQKNGNTGKSLVHHCTSATDIVAEVIKVFDMASWSFRLAMPSKIDPERGNTGLMQTVRQIAISPAMLSEAMNEDYGGLGRIDETSPVEESWPDRAVQKACFQSLIPKIASACSPVRK